MKKDRKKRKEAIKRLEGLEYWNKSARNVTTVDVVAALCPKLLRNVYTGELNLETCAELLQEVKSLVDITDYITCPRSKEKKAIHIGDIVYEVGGDGEPLTVEEIFISHYGTAIECKSLSGKWLSYRPQRLTFDKPEKEVIIPINDLRKHLSNYCVIHYHDKDVWIN